LGVESDLSDKEEIEVTRRVKEEEKVRETGSGSENLMSDQHDSMDFGMGGAELENSVQSISTNDLIS